MKMIMRVAEVDITLIRIDETLYMRFKDLMTLIAKQEHSVQSKEVSSYLESLGDEFANRKAQIVDEPDSFVKLEKWDFKETFCCPGLKDAVYKGIVDTVPLFPGDPNTRYLLGVFSRVDTSTGKAEGMLIRNCPWCNQKLPWMTKEEEEQIKTNHKE